MDVDALLGEEELVPCVTLVDGAGPPQRPNLRLVETVSDEDDGEYSGKSRTVRVVGTVQNPNRAGNDRVTSRQRNVNRYCG